MVFDLQEGKQSTCVRTLLCLAVRSALRLWVCRVIVDWVRLNVRELLIHGQIRFRLK